MNAPDRMLAIPQRKRLSVENFLLLNDSGAFADHAKAELIDGDIRVINAQYCPHANAKSQLLVALALQLRAIGGDLRAVAEVAVRLNGETMPEPDIVVCLAHGRGPVPAEKVALAIEVSDSTLEADLGRKAALYAPAGIPEYWVVDLDGARVAVHGRPDGGGYRERRDIPFGETLISATIDGLAVESASLIA